MSARSSSRIYVLGGVAAVLAVLNVADHLPWSGADTGMAATLGAPNAAGILVSSAVEVAPTDADTPMRAAQTLAGVADPDPWSFIMSADVMMATVERPLFRPSRRPYVVPAPRPAPKPVAVVKPAPPPPDPGGLKLVGIIKGKQGAVVLLHDSDSGDSKSVRVGESFRGWTIAGVRKSHVVVRQKSVQAELHLFKQPE